MLLGKQYFQSAPRMLCATETPGAPAVTKVQNNGRIVWTHMSLGA